MTSVKLKKKRYRYSLFRKNVLISYLNRKTICKRKKNTRKAKNKIWVLKKRYIDTVFFAEKWRKKYKQILITLHDLLSYYYLSVKSDKKKCAKQLKKSVFNFSLYFKIYLSYYNKINLLNYVINQTKRLFYKNYVKGNLLSKRCAKLSKLLRFSRIKQNKGLSLKSQRKLVLLDKLNYTFSGLFDSSLSKQRKISLLWIEYLKLFKEKREYKNVYIATSSNFDEKNVGFESTTINNDQKFKSIEYRSKKAFSFQKPLRQLRRLRYLHRKELQAAVPINKRVKSIVTCFQKEKKWKQDVFYNSFWFAKVINKFIKQGKKQKSENIFSGVISLLKEQQGILPKIKREQPFLLFWKILVKIKPIALTVPKRIGKIYHNIPIPIKLHRSFKVVLKWFSIGSRLNNEATLKLKILTELNSITENRRTFTQKQRDNLYLLINENRTNSHFRWI